MKGSSPNVDSTLAGLRAIRELLSDPERFTHKASALTSSGRTCHSDSPDAVQWCLIGAWCKQDGDNEHSLEALYCAADVLGHRGLTYVARAGHDRTLQVIDLAISQTDISTPAKDQNNG